MKKNIRMINQRLSLRKPQKEALDVLSKMTDFLSLDKNIDLEKALEKISLEYPTVESFEREFPNLCFALATGVGKTRLMGAFISYLYLEKGIKNFFVLAPNNTIHDKLIRDFSKPNHEKYVFQGIPEITQNPPKIINRDNFQRGAGIRNDRDLQKDLFDAEGQIHINIFNISKINTRVGGQTVPLIKKFSEYIGESYFEYLSGLDDLVLIMDEAHRYRAKAAMEALNTLNPVLGLELTATPQITHLSQRKAKANGSSFKNIAYSYPLAQALSDGFVKEPAVATRENFDPDKYSEQELEILKIKDGIHIHEETKLHLQTYSIETGTPFVKPFILIVAQDTAHANFLRKRIESSEFFNGSYKGKAIAVHSAKSGDEEEEMIRDLLQVESSSNPVEIVIHVNMLKEGWDVRNLYTIVPLRAANFKILIEQSIGRGLRLPFGKKTGIKEIDTLTIISHDRFREIVDAANHPNSIIRRGIIIGKEIPEEGSDKVEVRAKYLDEMERSLPTEEHVVVQHVFSEIENQPLHYKKCDELIIQSEVAKNVQTKLKSEGYDISEERIQYITQKARDAKSKFTISIPRITTVTEEVSRGYYSQFQLNLDKFHPQPIEQLLLKQYLTDGRREKIGSHRTVSLIDAHEEYIVNGLLSFDEVADDHIETLYGLAGQVTDHLLRVRKYSKDQIGNILHYHHKSLLSLIYSQMQTYYVPPEHEFKTALCEGSLHLKNMCFTSPKKHQEPINYMDQVEEMRDISNYLFKGFKKSIYPIQKFHSNPERLFARLLETDPDVLKWVKPPRKHFSIYYNQESAYEPDFVAETRNHKYLCEVKRSSEMNDATVLQKSDAAYNWCRTATEHLTAQGEKSWSYLLIPHDAVKTNMTIQALALCYTYERK